MKHHRQTGKLFILNELPPILAIQFATTFQFAGRVANWHFFQGHRQTEFAPSRHA
jgi:hypothetical protein